MDLKDTHLYFTALTNLRQVLIVGNMVCMNKVLSRFENHVETNSKSQVPGLLK